MDQAALARAKRLGIIGAVVLWVVCPLAIGGFVRVGVALADHNKGHGVSGWIIALLVVWGALCFVLLILGFACLLGGVFLWWRSRNPKRPVVTTTSEREAAKAEILQQMRADLAERRHSDEG